MKDQKIQRHAKSAIFMHWFNAVCWILLLLTGFGMIVNQKLQPFGMGWPSLTQAIFGDGERQFMLHWIVGTIWAVAFLVYGLFWMRPVTIPFLKEIFSFSIKRDLLWLVKKGIQMTLGNRGLEKLGFDLTLPDQGYYNAGQKLFAIPAVLGGIVITATGVTMILSKTMLNHSALVRWAMLIHFVTVGIVFASLFVHVFMAALARGEWPALKSMFTGYVSSDYARHHHKDWYDKVR